MDKIMALFFSIVLLFSACNQNKNAQNKLQQEKRLPMPKVTPLQKVSSSNSFQAKIFAQANSIILANGEVIGTINKEEEKIVKIPLKGADGKKKITIVLEDLYGNKSKALSLYIIKDTTAPVIKLKGEKTITISVGENYQDPGVEIKDNLDTSPKLTINGFVNNKKAGRYVITYKAIDKAQNSTSINRIVYVNKKIQNHPPLAKEDNVTIIQDCNITIDVLANDIDIDNDKLTLLDVQTPKHGKASLQNNKIFYIAEKNYSGYESFSYRIKDEKGAVATAKVNITIQKLPLLKDDRYTTTVATPLLLEPIANDKSGDGSNLDINSFKLLTKATHGITILSEKKQLAYMPDENFTGEEKIVYQLCNDAKEKKCNTATITIKVVQEENSSKVETKWGFIPFDIPNNTITLNQGENLQDALNSIHNKGGGIVHLKEGTFYGPVKIYSNTILEGEGINKTKIVIDPNNSNSHLIISAHQTKNIILRNFSVDASAQGSDFNAIVFAYGVENVLVENLAVKGGSRNNLLVWNESWDNSSKHITYKRVISYNAKQNHGLALRFVKGAVTQKVLAFNNKEYGIDYSRVYYGEITQAKSYYNGYGSKFPGSTYLYIHHSDFVNNQIVGMKFNRLSTETAPMHFHLSKIKIINSSAGAVDWGDTVEDPHFDTFVAQDIVLKGNAYNAVRLKSGYKAFSYGGDFIRNRDGKKITTEFESYTINPKKDIDPYLEDGVGYKSWKYKE